MTSEVCVMNRRAIVLAADSAATVTSYSEGVKEERYFKGSNKIFEMSAQQAIGIMIFDSADLQQVPWEIIVKAFRTSLGTKQCGTLHNYAEWFFRFIEEHRGLFPKDLLLENFVSSADQALIRILRTISTAPAVTAAAGNAANVSAAWASELDNYHLVFSGLPFTSGLSASDYDEARSRAELDLIREINIDLNQFCPGLPYPMDKLVEIAIKAIFTKPELYLQSTGLVIAGYGDEDYFPSYQEYECFGFVWSQLYYKTGSMHRILPASSGHIKAFATTGMVSTFTLGFGADVFNSVEESLKPVLQTFAGKIIKSLGGSAPSNLDDLITEAVDYHTHSWTQDMRKRNSIPLQRVIGFLPIPDMANLAETMINLQSLKEKVTRPSESVSGPIDVAVITKSEGFIWIKRKFFFDSALNPRYFLRQKQS